MGKRTIAISIDEKLWNEFIHKIALQKKGIIEKGDISNTITQIIQDYVRFYKPDKDLIKD